MPSDIWLVTVGEPLPQLDGDPRLLRTGLLADVLATRGHRVRWWVSAFDHANRRLRTPATYVIDRPNGASYDLTVLPALGYSRNISIGRITDHAYVARHYLREARRAETPPDAVVCSLPTLELCAASATLSREWGRPYLVDVRDLWPDIFERNLPPVAAPLAHQVLAPFRALARRGCGGAAGIVGITEPFVDWGVAWAGRPRGAWDLCIPFGYPDWTLTDDERHQADSFWHQHGLREGDAVVAYFGNIVAQVDLELVLTAARRLASNPRLKFVLCGSGDLLEPLRAKAADLPSVILPGRIDRLAIFGLMERSLVGIAPYVPTPDFLDSIPNKVVEYLSGGLPVLTSLQGGVVDRILGEEHCGTTYRPGSVDDLIRAIERYDDPEVRRVEGANARALYERSFRAEVVFDRYADHIEALAATVDPTPHGDRR